MKEIPLTQGKAAIVDDEDFDRLSLHKWHAIKGRGRLYTYYAIRNAKVNGRDTIIQMHREILGLSTGGPGIVDHKDGNGLHNSKNNIRLATYSTNNYNCKMKCSNTSGYRGVSWYERYGKWWAYINVNGKRIFCGYYSNKMDAVIARDKAAVRFYGKDAILNFP